MKVGNFIAIKQVGENPKDACSIIARFSSLFFSFSLYVIEICSKILVNFIDSFFGVYFCYQIFFFQNICVLFNF